jgi:hypothetical protein
VKFVDVPPAGKALGIAVVAVLAVIVAQGLGLIGPPAAFVGSVKSQAQNFITRIFKSAPGV